MAAAARPHFHSVAVELTDRCNLSCVHCYNAKRHDGPATAREPGEGTLARIRCLLNAVELDNVTLTGGEPLASPVFLAAARLIRDRGVPLQVITNGALLDDDIAASLCQIGARSVQVSLHGPDAPRHDAVTGLRSFDRSVRGVRLLRARHVPVVGCMVVTHENAAHVADTLALWRSLDVEHVALSRFSPAGMASAGAPHLLPTVPQLMLAFEQAAEAASSSGQRISCTMPIPACAMNTADYAPVRFGCCAIGTTRQEFALGTDGQLRHCTLHRRPVTTDIRASGHTGWPDLAVTDAREYRRIVPAFCQGCVHAATCGGGCGAASDWLLGDARGFPDPLLWQHVDDDFGARLAATRASGAFAQAGSEGGGLR